MTSLHEAVAAYLEALDAPMVRVDCVKILCDTCSDVITLTDPDEMRAALALSTNEETGYALGVEAFITYEGLACECERPYDVPAWNVEENGAYEAPSVRAEIPQRLEAMRRALETP